MVECDGLQLGESPAATGFAAKDWKLVLDEPPATAGQDRRLVKHARYYWLLLAESHLTRRLFRAMVGRI